MWFFDALAVMGSTMLLLMTFPFSVFFSLKVVREHERAVIFRLGRLWMGSRGPGFLFILPCIDSFSKVDIRTVSFNVPPQEVLTKDLVTVNVDAVVYYRVCNPLSAINNVNNYRHSTKILAATTLRNVLGTRNIMEIVSDREDISHTIQTSLIKATELWGIKIEFVEIKDIHLSKKMKRAMSDEAEAASEARAKVIAAEGEMKASRALKEASDVIAESPTALQLRYLQTLNSLSAKNNSTIMNLLTSLTVSALAFTTKAEGQKAF